MMLGLMDSVFNTYPIATVVVAGVVMLTLVRYSRNYVPPASAQVVNLPTNLKLIAAVMEVDEVVSVEDTRAILKDKLACHMEFHSRLISSPWWWPRYESVDVDMGVHVQAGPTMASNQQLQAFVSDLQNTPIVSVVGPNRPLWYCYVCSHEQSTGADALTSAGSVILVLDHALADGMSMIRIVFDLDTVTPTDKLFEGVLFPKKPAGSRPSLLVRAGAVVSAGVRCLRDLAELLLQRPDQPNALKATRHCTRSRLAWTPRGIPLDSIKRLGREMENATVNDVLTAAMTCALARRLKAGGHAQESLARLRCSSAVWVNLRDPRKLFRPNQVTECGNRIGAVVLPLCIGEDTLPATVRKVHDQMVALKSTMQPLVVHYLLRAVGLLPRVVYQAICPLLMDKPTVSLSNVPGPQLPMHFLNARVTSLQAFTRPLMTVSTFVVMLSYAGEVRVGVCSDVDVVNPTDILDDFTAIMNEAAGQ